MINNKSNIVIDNNITIINQTGEVWKLFKKYGANHYYISNKGRVKSCTNKGIRIMKTQIANNYERVHICGKMYFVHRMVALCFINNPNSKKYIEVNHKDKNTLNNEVENLEWVTSKENSQAKEQVVIYKLDLQGNVLDQYNSTTDAAVSVNGDRAAIAKCCRNKYSKTNIYHGYKWKYSNDSFINNYTNKQKRIAKLHPVTNEVLEIFYSLKDAANSVNVGKTCIHNAIQGYAKRAGGYKWKYYD